MKKIAGFLSDSPDTFDVSLLRFTEKFINITFDKEMNLLTKIFEKTEEERAES